MEVFESFQRPEDLRTNPPQTIPVQVQHTQHRQLHEGQGPQPPNPIVGQRQRFQRVRFEEGHPLRHGHAVVAQQQDLEFAVRGEGVFGHATDVVAGEVEVLEEGCERDGVVRDVLQVHVVGVYGGGVPQEVGVWYDGDGTHAGEVDASYGFFGEVGFLGA